MEQRHDLLHALRVEVRERLVQQEELRPADQGVRDEDPLLLSPGELPRRLSAKRSASTSCRICSTSSRWLRAPSREAVAMGVEPERDEVTRAHRDVGVDDDLLRHVAEGTAARRQRRAGDEDASGIGTLQSEKARSSVVLPTPLEPMRPVNSPSRTSKETWSSIRRPRQRDGISSTSRTGTRS